MSSDSEYVICPFNGAHRILKFRMPQHIIKCRKNYQGGNMATCPFNAQHIIEEGTMKTHLEDCQDYETAFREQNEKFFEK